VDTRVGDGRLDVQEFARLVSGAAAAVKLASSSNAALPPECISTPTPIEFPCASRHTLTLPYLTLPPSSSPVRHATRSLAASVRDS